MSRSASNTGSSWSKRLRVAVGIFLALVLGVVGILYDLSCRDYRPDLVARHGSLARVERGEDARDPHFTRTDLILHSTSGLSVECAMLVPATPSGAVPAFILLGGKQTGKSAVEYVQDIENVVVVAVDYPYDPRPSYTFGQVVQDLGAVRRALLDMPPSIMLVVDHLSHMPEVDTNRIVLAGYSFGAPFVPVTMALDERIDVAVMAYGGGGLTSLIYHNVRRWEGAGFSTLVAGLAGILLRPLEPLLFVGEIAPRPLVMINGLQDEQIPRSNVERLYVAAGDPKNIVWIDSRHVNPRNEELTRTIIREMKRELTRLGILTTVAR